MNEISTIKITFLKGRWLDHQVTGLKTVCFIENFIHLRLKSQFMFLSHSSNKILCKDRQSRKCDFTKKQKG